MYLIIYFSAITKLTNSFISWYRWSGSRVSVKFNIEFVGADPQSGKGLLMFLIITRDSEVIMFSPCVFVTCQNLQFWQVCSFDGLFVCLFVYHAIQVVVAIIIKLGPHMESGPSQCCIVFIGQRSNN